MRQFIKVSAELNQELQRVFNKSRMSIWKALAFVTRHEEATEIRNYALAHGGQYQEEDFIPNCRTYHQNGVMYQDFPGKVRVVIDTKDPQSPAIIYVNGKKEHEFTGVTINSWGNVLALAQERSNENVKL